MSPPPYAIRPGQTYSSRSAKRSPRKVIAIGPEHRPLVSEQPHMPDDSLGVLYLLPNGAQGRVTLASFIQWAHTIHTDSRPS